ncbi:MAG: actin interacting protein [Rhodobacteraceae bacterium]|nr:MAG: actin interacting protein [Paracoccaceae bacterium]
MTLPDTRPPLDIDQLVRGLITEIGADSIVDADQDLSRYFKDWSGDHAGTGLVVLRPATVENVCKAVRFCSQVGVPIVPQGGNSGLVGGAIDAAGGCVILSLERLNKIRGIDPVNLTAAVDAGCILQTLKAAVAARDCYFPVSLGAEGSAHIGGIVSTNAGGTNVVKHGMTRANIMGLEVVLPDGRLWSNLLGLRKDNRGPDLSQIFIGSEGIFGIVTGACLRLSPAPKTVETAYVGCASFHDAMQLLTLLRRQCHEFLSGFEIISNRCLPLARLAKPDLRVPIDAEIPVHVLIELSCAGPLPLMDILETFLGAALEAGQIVDAAIAQNKAQAGSFWAIREGLVEGQALNGYHVRSDVSVRLSAIPELITKLEAMLAQDFPGWTALPYGHAGDGNVHFSAVPPKSIDPTTQRSIGKTIETAIFRVVAGLDGSFSAEHGIGRSKRDRLAATADPVQLDLLARLKSAIDPTGVMNPGCLIAPKEPAR